MKRTFKCEHKKFLRRLIVQSNNCDTHNVETIKLKEPYKRGWNIVVDLRADIKRSKLGPIYEELIPYAFSKPSFTRDVKYIKAIRKSGGRPSEYNDFLDYNYSYGKRPYKLLISDDKFKKTIPLHLRKYFYYTDEMRQRISYARRTRTWFRYHGWRLKLPQYIFLLKVKPNIITHRDIPNSIAESEEAKINNRLYALNAYHIMYSHNRSWTPRYRSHDRAKEKRNTRAHIQEEIDELGMYRYVA